jgi:hypothetical protein
MDALEENRCKPRMKIDQYLKSYRGGISFEFAAKNAALSSSLADFHVVADGGSKSYL